MSKISLAPAAAGTAIFTIESPGTSTNRTLTLPDDTGTIVTNSGNQAGSFTTLNTSGAVVFNDAGADVDFRVEGDTEANLLFVDASADAVGIGTSSPSSVARASFGNDSGTSPALYGAFFGTNSATSAAAPNFGLTIGWNKSGGGGESNIIYGVSAGSTPALAFSTSDGSTVTERMRIDSSGNVLINTTANVNNAKLKSKVSAGSFGLEVTDESQSDFVVAPLSGAVCRVGPTAGAMAFYSDNAERARITSGGDLCIGTTATSSSARLNVRRESLTSTTKAANTIAKFGPGTGTNRDANIICSDYTAYDYFFGGRGGVAYVTVNNNQGVQLSAGGTSWSSDSDETLKDIIEPITNAIETVGQWRTVIGKYKTDEEDKRRVFFIAQDFQESLPEAVDESPEGTLLLRYQDAIPVLAAAIKELKAELDTVKAELATLKG